MIKQVFLFLVVGFCAGSLQAQDTLRIMYYNILNFPAESPERVEDLRKIVGFSKPDIIVVNELLTEGGANLILSDALNVFGASNYAAATFIDGPDTDNMLYYNSDVLGLKNQQQIPTGLRDISEYQLYYKSPGLSAASDTICLNIYSLHLKAGTGFFNQRKEEALVLKFRLNSLENPENIFVGGDFNFYSGNESGCLALRETGMVDLFDPIDAIGDWNNNSSYAAIHTQSTRVAPLSDGSGGGMDDRFDLIFTSSDVLDNTNGLSFIEGSYQALGQDGLRFNASVNSPFNPSVPDSIADALFYMSDHLPVLMDLKTDYTASIENLNDETLKWYYSSNSNEIRFNQMIRNADFLIFDYSGNLIMRIKVENTQVINLPVNLSKGLFIWNLIGESNNSSDKIILQ